MGYHCECGTFWRDEWAVAECRKIHIRKYTHKEQASEAVDCVPIIDCEMSDLVDGTCNDTRNPIPECNPHICPRLHAEIKLKL